jgi:hypothetical protein
MIKKNCVVLKSNGVFVTVDRLGIVSLTETTVARKFTEIF